MQFTLSFDLRAPGFGAPAREISAAALDQCAWADDLGFDAVGLGEHHASDDGYLPSPLVFGAAVAARTRHVTIRPSVLLAPFYDPIKLAEDTAVLQLVSGGRLVLGLGAGYRPAEFALFGVRREDRVRRVVETVEVLRRAWTGEPFDFRGRCVRVTPAADPPPPILLGGAHPAVARRAARIADGFFPPQGECWEVYREACRELGKPDPGPCARLGPPFLHVARDPDAAWERIAPHAAHVVRSYAAWTEEAFGRAAGPFAAGVDPGALRASGAYPVLTPEQAVAHVRGMAPHGVLLLTPLLGGLDPDLAWESLRLFEREVWPAVRHLRDGR